MGNRNVVRERRRDFAILFWRDAGEISKLPGEMRLIAVTGGHRQIYPGGRWIGGNTSQGFLKPENAAIQFRRQPDRMAEQRDESPVAVAARHHDLAHVVGGPELFKSLSNGRVKTTHGGKPRGKERFKHFNLPVRRTSLQELFARQAGRPAPEIVQKGVVLGQLAGRYAEQKLGRARKKLGAY